MTALYNPPFTRGGSRLMPKFLYINSEFTLTFEEQNPLFLFPVLNFENLDPISLEFQYVTFENQDTEAIMPNNFARLTFENQDTEAIPNNFAQLTFENQDTTTL